MVKKSSVSYYLFSDDSSYHPIIESLLREGTDPSNDLNTINKIKLMNNTIIGEDVTKAVTIPTTEEINQQYQNIQLELSVREKHLAILPSFHLDDMEDLLKAISVKSIKIN